MILAVLKRAGFRLGAKDVFLNVTGGMMTRIDLAVVSFYPLMKIFL
jgi:predicted ATP-dependent serine protease